MSLSLESITSPLKNFTLPCVLSGMDITSYSSKELRAASSQIPPKLHALEITQRQNGMPPGFLVETLCLCLQSELTRLYNLINSRTAPAEESMRFLREFLLAEKRPSSEKIH
jgi:hypothetical protein